jgi:hypothetical protein
MMSVKGNDGEKGESGVALLSASTPVNATIAAGQFLCKSASGTLEGKDALEITGGTMQGALVAQNNPNFMVKQVRNIYMSVNEPPSTGGSNGDIWIKYIP